MTVEFMSSDESGGMDEVLITSGNPKQFQLSKDRWMTHRK